MFVSLLVSLSMTLPSTAAKPFEAPTVANWQHTIAYTDSGMAMSPMLNIKQFLLELSEELQLHGVPSTYANSSSYLATTKLDDGRVLMVIINLPLSDLVTGKSVEHAGFIFQAPYEGASVESYCLVATQL